MQSGEHRTQQVGTSQLAGLPKPLVKLRLDSNGIEFVAFQAYSPSTSGVGHPSGRMAHPEQDPLSFGRRPTQATVSLQFIREVDQLILGHPIGGAFRTFSDRMGQPPNRGVLSLKLMNQWFGRQMQPGQA
ncbi:MAG: hypothetical protein BWY72_01888 [Bacteroidetes bacterium ADurb.Bin416]|nr:MAG: hypothetical protein BWY72_01888 [Bacteroidetes bacterium ADurb.Bin416]